MADILTEDYGEDDLSPHEKAIQQVGHERIWGKAYRIALRKGLDHGRAAKSADEAEARAVLKWKSHFEALA